MDGDFSEIPLANKVLLDPRETLSTLYMSRMRLQGHTYHIRDDPVRWAHFQRMRTVHMKLDLAKLQHRVVDNLVTDLAKFFDVIAQDVHPNLGAAWAWATKTTWPPTRRASRIPYH